MSKKINQLDEATDEEALNDSYLLAIADATNGLAKKMTVSQAKEAYGAKRLKYVSTGSEGATLTLSQLLGKDILMITRGMGVIHLSEDITPESDEYYWDQTSITLGTEVNPDGGEKFTILYRNF